MQQDNEGKQESRKRRGEITSEDLKAYLSFSDFQMITLLKDKEAKRRTIAATLLGEHQCQSAVHHLCQAIQREKALYARLAIAEALHKIGKTAVNPLCDMLGEIGRNQEKVLPERCCEKKSYPLVRDLAGRILTKIGVEAIPALTEILSRGKSFQIEQAIDALGAIAYRTGDHSALESLFRLIEKESDNDFLMWKITRSLGGFQSIEAVKKLIEILHQFAQPAIRWEAARSIGQIGIHEQFIIVELENALLDPDPRVNNAIANAIKRLKPEWERHIA